MTVIAHETVLPDLDVSRSAFLLDVDGTLLDIAPAPGAVNIPQRLPAALEDLQRLSGGAIAFVSGRTLEQLDKLFSPLRMAAIGSHGGEIRYADGRVDREPPLPESVKREFLGLGDLDPRILVEDKGCSLAFHYRLVPEIRPALFDALVQRKDLLEAAGLQVLRGKAIVEIKPRRFNKATATRKLLLTPPFSNRTPLFAGDDRTDEDVFAILPEFRGIGISVGRKMAGAQFTAKDPQAMREWLSGLAAGSKP